MTREKDPRILKYHTYKHDSPNESFSTMNLRGKYNLTPEHRKRRKEKTIRELNNVFGENALEYIKTNLIAGTTIRKLAMEAQMAEMNLANRLKILNISKKTVRKEIYEKAKEENIVASLREEAKLVLILYFDEGLNTIQIAKWLSNQGKKTTHQNISDLIRRNIRNLYRKLIK